MYIYDMRWQASWFYNLAAISISAQGRDPQGMPYNDEIVEKEHVCFAKARVRKIEREYSQTGFSHLTFC